mmetsp:Transcript_45966/g.84274  ORF Transcript_45966/g.84274 Transcript_45966/m.84274 type:complete len:117 (-) Transcript_45966:650-1000(-)
MHSITVWKTGRHKYICVDIRTMIPAYMIYTSGLPLVQDKIENCKQKIGIYRRPPFKMSSRIFITWIWVEVKKRDNQANSIRCGETEHEHPSRCCDWEKSCRHTTYSPHSKMKAVSS